jgi:antitoxin HicB
MPTEIEYSVVLEPQEGGGFTVVVPALPEVVTEGDSEEEALRMVKEAIRAVLEYRGDHGIPIPSDVLPEVRQIRVAAAE